MTQLTKNFSLDELKATSTGIRNNCSNSELLNIRRLADVLQTLRDALGRPITVSSGFRNDAVNRKVGGSATSAHRKGLAADLSVAGMSSTELARFIHAELKDFDQIILEHPDKERTWVHLGIGPGNRKQLLVATKPLGDTIYTPVKGF